MQDNFETQNEENLSAQEEMPEQELSHTDKLVGIFTEPVSTFEQIAKFKPKTIDWLLPVLLMFIVVGIVQIVMMSNPIIRYDVIEKQITAMEKRLDESVKKGDITQTQADQQLNAMRDNMEKMGTGVFLVFQIIGIFVVGFIVFFIITAIYYLFAKFIFKDSGNYSSALVASGLTAYIGIIQMIIVLVSAMLTDRIFSDTSVASFLNIDKSSFTGWLLAKLDIFTIWSYIVAGIGFSKMFQSKNTGKYWGLIFGLWLLWSLLMFFIGDKLPFGMGG